MSNDYPKKNEMVSMVMTPADHALANGVSERIPSCLIAGPRVTMIGFGWKRLERRLDVAATGERPRGVNKKSWAKVEHLPRERWTDLADRIRAAMTA